MQRDAELLDGEDNAVVAFVGRVLGALLTLIVLAACVVAIVGLAYWSKHGLQRPLHGAQTGPGSAAVQGP